MTKTEKHAPKAIASIQFYCNFADKQETTISVKIKTFLLPLLGLAVLLTSFLPATAHDLPAQYRKLDATLEQSSKYIEAHEQLLSREKARLREARSSRQQLNLCYRIYKDYAAFQTDSAIVYLNRCITLSEASGNTAFVQSCLALKATQFSIAGYYAEALTTLGKVERQKLDRTGWQNYYYALNHVYGEMASYTNDTLYRAEYFRKAGAYRDSIFRVFPASSEAALNKREEQCSSRKDFARALQFNDFRLKLAPAGSHTFAIAAYFRYVELSGMGSKDEALYWLTESAMADIRNAVMDQASLWLLAHELAKSGDIDRSHRYIDHAWQFANLFNARTRSWQISPILRNIDTIFQQKEAESNRQLILLIVLATVLLVVLAISLAYLVRQRQRLAEANRQLDESSRVKEAYIGRFLTTCSLYIDKLDKLRLAVYKLVKSHQYDKVLELTRTAGMKNKDMEALYEHFDEVFLNLFPSFVDQINTLLRPDAQFVLNDPKRLTTPLRVFALIRLGMDDSTKIAECLHYSVNTIYNYRAKVRNGALGKRNEFEKKVKMIGTV